MSRGYPAIVLGVTTGGGAHTVHEYIDIAPVETGIEQLVRFVDRVFRAAETAALRTSAGWNERGRRDLRSSDQAARGYFKSEHLVDLQRLRLALGGERA